MSVELYAVQLGKWKPREPEHESLGEAVVLKTYVKEGTQCVSVKDATGAVQELNLGTFVFLFEPAEGEDPLPNIIRDYPVPSGAIYGARYDRGVTQVKVIETATANLSTGEEVQCVAYRQGKHVYVMDKQRFITVYALIDAGDLPS